MNLIVMLFDIVLKVKQRTILRPKRRVTRANTNIGEVFVFIGRRRSISRFAVVLLIVLPVLPTFLRCGYRFDVIAVTTTKVTKTRTRKSTKQSNVTFCCAENDSFHPSHYGPSELDNTNVKNSYSNDRGNITRTVATIDSFMSSELESKRRILVQQRNLIREDNAYQEYSFPSNIRATLVGMSASVNRNEFIKKFDTGIPAIGTVAETAGNDRVLLLYGSNASLPSKSSSGAKSSTILSVEDAVENCDVVKVVMIKSYTTEGVNNNDIKNECLAVVGNGPTDSSQIHTWSRYGPPLTNSKGNKTTTKPEPRMDHFEYLPYHYRATSTPSPKIEKIAFEELRNYLEHYEQALLELQPILSRATSSSTGRRVVVNDYSKSNNRVVIVMISNRGHSQYLVNFICAARARKIDIRNLVVFATDTETHELASSMNVLSYHNADIFGTMPLDEPTQYTNIEYGHMFMSKVYCVHLVNALNYDVLFADLDMAWYQDPIPYFQQKIREAATSRHLESQSQRDDNVPPPIVGHDIYISYNGHYERKFKPFALNTGFYFVQSNYRTKYFFSMLVRMGDMVLLENSHQTVFGMLVNEHTAVRGLRVQTLHNDWKLFLTGYEYMHSPQREYVDDVIHDTRSVVEPKPILFHANFFVKQEKRTKLIETKNWFLKDSQKTINIQDLSSNENAQCAVIATPNQSSLLPKDPIAECCLSSPVTV